jgi:putative ABC transport system substrate-binding protein
MHSALKDAIEHKADVVLVGVPAAAIAARRITRDTPIVCASCGDPLDYGLVDSLARPGGNVTGLASLSAELVGKRLQLLRQVAPQATRLAAFINPDNPGTQANLRALERAAPALGFALQRVDFRSPADFDPAFRSAAAAGAHAVIIQDDPFTVTGRAAIGQLSMKHRLPVIAGIPEVADAGALIVYGPDRNELYRRAAGFVDRILKGTKPADLPIEQPSTFELVINVKSAKALGVPLSQDLLARANRVIH